MSKSEYISNSYGHVKDGKLYDEPQITLPKQLVEEVIGALELAVCRYDRNGKSFVCEEVSKALKALRDEIGEKK